MLALSAADRSSSLERGCASSVESTHRRTTLPTHTPPCDRGASSSNRLRQKYWQTQLHSSHNPREGWYRYARSCNHRWPSGPPPIRSTSAERYNRRTCARWAKLWYQHPRTSATQRLSAMWSVLGRWCVWPSRPLGPSWALRALDSEFAVLRDRLVHHRARQTAALEPARQGNAGRTCRRTC
jgi:hypothetical protein